MLSSRLRLRARRKRSGAKLCASEHANPGPCPQHARRTCLQRRLRDSPSAMERARTQRVLRSRARMRASRRVHSPCGLRFHALRIPTRCLARSGPSCLGRPCNVHRAPGASACCHHRAGLHNRGGRGPFRTHQQRRSAAAHRLPHARRVKIAGHHPAQQKPQPYRSARRARERINRPRGTLERRTPRKSKRQTHSKCRMLRGTGRQPRAKRRQRGKPQQTPHRKPKRRHYHN